MACILKNTKNETKLLFIEVPKAGSSTVFNFMKQVYLYNKGEELDKSISKWDIRLEWFDRHDSALYLNEAYNENAPWSELKKFAVVRNPYDWAVSRFKWRDDVIKVASAKGGLSDSEIVEKFSEDLKKLKMSQIDYIADEEGNIMVDKLLKLEDGLDKELPKLFKKWGFEIPPSIEVGDFNNSEDRTRETMDTYQKYYTDEVRDIVTEKNKKIIEMFNYEF